MPKNKPKANFVKQTVSSPLFLITCALIFFSLVSLVINIKMKSDKDKLEQQMGNLNIALTTTKTSSTEYQDKIDSLQAQVKQYRDITANYETKSWFLYKNSDAKFQLFYFPKNVKIKADKLSSLPRETATSTCKIFGQDFFNSEKQAIEKAKAGSACEVAAECGLVKNARTFCQVQEQGGFKGKLEIFDLSSNPDDIVIRYRFYTNNYKVELSPYNSTCGQNNQPCDYLKRGQGINAVTADKIIDAYLNSKSLAVKNNSDTINLGEIFSNFQKSLGSLAVIK